MTFNDHQVRHILLHESLLEIVEDYLLNCGLERGGARISGLMAWSERQVKVKTTGTRHHNEEVLQ